MFLFYHLGEILKWGEFMKRKVTLSLAALAMVAGSSAFGVEDLSSMFSEGKTSGQIRLFSIDRLY